MLLTLKTILPESKVWVLILHTNNLNVTRVFATTENSSSLLVVQLKELNKLATI